MRVLRTCVPAMLWNVHCRTMVNLHGPAFLSAPRPKKTAERKHVIMKSSSSSMRVETMTPPPDPSTLLTEAQLKERATMVRYVSLTFR